MIQRILHAVPCTAASEALLGIKTPCIRPDCWQGLFQDYDPVLCTLTTVLVTSVCAALATGARELAAERPPGASGLKDWRKALGPNGSMLG